MVKMSNEIIKSKLDEIRQHVFIGKAGLEENEIKKISDEINQIFSDPKNFSIVIQNHCSEILYEIFKSIPTAHLAEIILSELESEHFYKFSKFLVDKGENDTAIKSLVHELLNLFRYSVWLQKISKEEKWEILFAELIELSNYNFKAMFNQRVRDYSDKILFKVIKGERYEEHCWEQVKKIVQKYSKCLQNVLDGFETEDMDVAFLMENSLEMALLDIASLSEGIRNVMVPANSVSAHISFILNQTKVPIVIVSNEKQLSKIKSIKYELKYLKKVILLEGKSIEEWVIPFSEFLLNNKNELIEKEVNVNDLTSIMYTSGTTGDPKGIMFSQMNIIYKRFMRAMALPKISDKDLYLSFLPLFHTFGRFLELSGSIFWGAEYCFMENPSVETMISNMNLVKPTIFISIPKKWLQLYEAVNARVNIELDSDAEIQKAVIEVTGGELKWGLSAAGFLPSEVFAFFQKYGITLMSGFGMTEATGGISMTPPEEYYMNSLGRALPGIEMKVASDGELLIRGKYVMIGYYQQENSITFDTEGWLPTGDIMKQDKNGFIEIIDRKKEIYKNIKGETIAPQKIENYFRDFENIKQVFLVGDHRPFNTILIFPNYSDASTFFKKMDEKQIHEYFSSIIVTVNNFIAPFERIVNFRIIERAFDVDKGEVTPKGTYKRRIIENNFENEIESMYEKTHTNIKVGNIEVKIPNWFLREKGSLSGDVVAVGNELMLPKLNKQLVIDIVDKKKHHIQIGSYIYSLKSNHLDLQPILTNASLWLGNKELSDFTGDSIIQWTRKHATEDGIHFIDTSDIVLGNINLITEMERYISAGEDSLFGLHKALLMLQSDSFGSAQYGIKYISQIISDNQSINFLLVKTILLRPNISKLVKVRREMLKLVFKYNREFDLVNVFNLYLDFDSNLIEEDIIASAVNNINKNIFIDVIENILNNRLVNYKRAKDINLTCYPTLLNLVSQFGILHPTTYERLRQIIVNLQLMKEHSTLSELAWKARFDLRTGFREWLGKNQKIAVDMENGDEYMWSDVLVFEEGINPRDLNLMTEAITESPILREAIFLFSKGKVISLSNILPSGVWISYNREYSNKTLYRISVQTRYEGAFHIILTINKDRSDDEIYKEVNWLVLAGSETIAKDLVEDFGGYWRDYKVWTSQYNPGDSVYKLISREIRKNDDFAKERIIQLWPFFIWNASVTVFNFWLVSGKRHILTDTTTKNFIIPSHDYQTGTKILSLSETLPFKNISHLIESFYNSFILETINQYDFLEIKKIWNYIFSGIIDAIGEKEGIKLLLQYKSELEEKKINDFRIDSLNNMISLVENRKFLPKRLYFAIKRFHRWFNLNSNASLSAQAEMLKELYVTYHLNELEKTYPEARTRFFSETVFLNSSNRTKDVLNRLAAETHGKSEMNKEDLHKQINNLQAEYELSAKEKFFLARLSFPHLKPTVTADFMKVNGEVSPGANLVIQINDYEGNPFFIRMPVSPKEISKLHQLFIDTKLLVSFQNKHNFLVAISERGFVIGGLLYLKTSNNTVHMEKIVVSDHHRRKGISDLLMNEFFERMKSDGYKYVTTGFFRPEYFYRLGFKVERKYSGLVKELNVDSNNNV
jgi:long-chain acyl-CoA synthetase